MCYHCYTLRFVFAITVLTGRVKQKLLSPGFGALLAVEVEEILVAGNLTTTITTYLDGPLAVIRDVAQDACQCHDAKPGKSKCSNRRYNSRCVSMSRC